MAQSKVTGEIGDEKVVLENIATEATLLSLLEAFNKMSKAKGETPEQLKERKKSAEELSKAQKEAVETTKNFEESVGNAGDVLDDMSSGLGMLAGAIGAVGGLFLGLTGAVSSLTVGFMQNGDRLSDMVTTNFLFLGDMARAIDDNIAEFRNMATVGATFGNSLLETRLAAANSNLSLEQFSSLVKSNAETLAIFGSTTQSGARQFGQLSRQLIDGDIGARLQGMGFTVEGINEGLANYIEIQARTGRLETRSRNQLIEGTRNYLEEVDALARITGMQRDEAQQAMLAQQEEAKFRTMRARIDTEEGRARFDANMAFMKQLGPMGNAMMDLADGAASTEQAQYLLSAMGPQIMDLSQAMASGALSAEQARNQLAEMGPTARSFTRSFDPAAFEQLPPALAEILNSFYMLNRLNEDASELTEEEQARQEAATKALTSFERTIRTVKERIMRNFLTSGIFESVTEQFERLSEHLTTEKINEYLDTFANKLAWVTSWWDRFIENTEKAGLFESLRVMFADIFNNLQAYLFGGTLQQTELQRGPRVGRIAEITVEGREIEKGLVEKFTEGLSNWYDTSGLKDVFTRMAEDITKAFEEKIFGTGTISFREAARLDAAEKERKRLEALQSEAVIFRNPDGELVQSQNAEKGAERVRTKNVLNEIAGLIHEQKIVENSILNSVYGVLGRLNPLRGEAVMLDYNTGTGGIKDFGVETPAMLHGREAVLTEDQLFNMANGALAVGTRNAVSNLNQNLSKQNDDQSTQMLANAVTELKNSVANTSSSTQSTTNNSLDNKIDQLNNTMESVLSVLMESNGMNKKQLNATRSMSGNLVYGVPS